MEKVSKVGVGRKLNGESRKRAKRIKNERWKEYLNRKKVNKYAKNNRKRIKSKKLILSTKAEVWAEFRIMKKIR